jgi:hypothetical protein
MILKVSAFAVKMVETDNLGSSVAAPPERFNQVSEA